MKGKPPTAEELALEEKRKGWAIFFRDLDKEADEWPSIFIRQYGRSIFERVPDELPENAVKGN